MDKSKKFVILFSEVKRLAEQDKSLLDQNDIEAIEINLTAEVLKKYSEKKPLVTVISDNILLSQPAIYEKIQCLSSIVAVVIKKNQNSAELQYLLHHFPQVYFLHENFETRDIYLLAQQAKEKYEKDIHQLHLRKEASQKNKVLEELNQNLEKIVDVHTADLRESHIEEKNKLKQERDFLQFILEMQRVVDLESAHSAIRKRFKSLSAINEVFIFIDDQVSSKIWIYKNGKSFAAHIAKVDLLPQVLSRPVGRIEKLPLLNNPLVEIWIEVMTAGDLQTSFINEFQNWTQICRLAMQRVLHDESLIHTAKRWVQIFDGLNAPVSIINSNYQIVRANAEFYKHKNKEYCFQTFANRSKPCEGCPLGKKEQSQIQVGDSLFVSHSHKVSDDRYVHYYEDVTKTRGLYAQLVQTEKLGAMGALAGQVAHELNNPLSGIMSLSQTLQMGLDTNSNLFKDLVEVEKASARCQNIIQQLLEFTREGGLAPIETSLNEVIEKTIPLLKTSYRLFRLNMILSPENPKIMVEPQLLQQVIFNLVQNAAQALADYKEKTKTNPKFIGEITILTRLNKDYVEFEISDNGPGIPKDIQPRLFQAFFTTKDVGKGTGLGLYLSKKIMEKFSGELIFQSTDQGTTFIGRWVNDLQQQRLQL